nr:hypothetical protein Iba_chr14aCG24810 [Ipomoea batatas]
MLEGTYRRADRRRLASGKGEDEGRWYLSAMEPIVESKPIIESTDWEDFTNEVERIKTNWEDLINEKGYEISGLKELMAKSRSLIDQGDSSIAKVILLIDQVKSLIPPITNELEKEFENVKEEEFQEIEEEETDSYLAKFKDDIAALEAQLKRKSIHVELLILAPKKKRSRAIILIALIVALICSIEEEETDSYLAKFKEDIVALEAQLTRKSYSSLICSIEEEEIDSYLAKFKEDVAALEAQLKRKSIHYSERSASRLWGCVSILTIPLILLSSLLVEQNYTSTNRNTENVQERRNSRSIERGETDSYLAKFKDDIAALEGAA